jgi:hypothetical protein
MVCKNHSFKCHFGHLGLAGVAADPSRTREIPMISGRIAKILLPPTISAVLLAGVVWWVTPQRLAAAAAELDWLPLVGATAAMVIGLYIWDAVCLPAVYQVGGGRIRFLQALHLRGLTYLGGALNYELGQGALAWGTARTQGASFAAMLARSVLLAYHDMMVLLLAGGAGALLSSDERVVRLRPVIAVGLAIGVGVAVFVWLLPNQWRNRLHWADKQVLLAGWNWRRSLRLIPLRTIYFGILVVYAMVALAICRLAIDWQVALSAVPLVVLADGLPSFASLGSRETMLHLTLAPGEQNATLVAMSLVWSVGMIVGRLAIATVHMWLHRTRRFGDAFSFSARDDKGENVTDSTSRSASGAKALRRSA